MHEYFAYVKHSKKLCWNNMYFDIVWNITKILGYAIIKCNIETLENQLE